MSDDNPLDGRSRATLLLIGAIPILLVFLGIGMFGYIDYSHDNSMEKACVEQYGEGADWVGNVVTGEGEVLICETPDGELRRSNAPNEWRGSFSGYIDSLLTFLTS